MKVLHITGYITGGAGIAVMRLHQALLAQQVDSKILCFFARDENLVPGVYPINQNKSRFQALLEKCKLDKNSRLIRGMTGDYEFFSFPFSTLQLHQHPLVQEADIIHLHWISNFVDIPSFFTHVKKKLIWTAHDLNPILGGFHYENDVVRSPNFAPAEQYLRKVKQEFIRKANVHFIASSAQSVQKIRQALPGIACDRIPCVLDTEHFLPVDKQVARQALRLPENTLILGTGADDLKNYRKGYWLLLEAIEQLPESEKKELTLFSFGAFSHGKNDTPENPYPAIVRFPPVHDKRLHSLVYSVMDYFVVPSMEETFGLTGTEALLCNTPLLAARTGGMPDYTQEGKNGHLFTPGNATELATLIKEALRHKREGHTPFTNPREQILQWYKEENPVEKHIRLYQTSEIFSARRGKQEYT